MSHFLLLGDRGMLGRAFRELFAARGHTHEGLDLPELDIADPARVGRALDPRYAAVINCAAFTNVDGAEADEPAAHTTHSQRSHQRASWCSITPRPWRSSSPPGSVPRNVPNGWRYA